MEFIQIGIQGYGAWNGDSFCFGLKQVDRTYGRDDLYKFRSHQLSSQNGSVGRYCEGLNKTSFKLTLIF